MEERIKVLEDKLDKTCKEILFMSGMIGILVGKLQMEMIYTHNAMSSTNDLFNSWQNFEDQKMAVSDLLKDILGKNTKKGGIDEKN